MEVAVVCDRTDRNGEYTLACEWARAPPCLGPPPSGPRLMAGILRK